MYDLFFIDIQPIGCLVFLKGKARYIFNFMEIVLPAFPLRKMYLCIELIKQIKNEQN